ncbi:hypothetical protein DW753_13480 [Agathobacter rectalis]|uniref:Uncharacterized protein n=1 Tax=Agathobacter rectalis TaxID=39491 RepID=A0A414IQM9_9FIRM|nr:hypothetical protein [Agathobacter rectalis]RGT07962.1 hypothetical protein DWX52_13555 [Agathobacter rectalis]RGT15836.1 hypothetical protein DWX50_13675 [Agathobacter rectalis]RHE30686.1 hypothetical protein DW753_13480 [Agathobacter rectalis]
MKIERYGLECVENKFLKLPNVQKYELLKRTNVSVLENKLKLLKKDMGIESYLTGFSGVIKFDCIRMKFFG